MSLTRDVSTPRTFFDITHLVEYAKKCRHVSGAQRVEIRILANILARHPEADIELMAFDRRAKRFVLLPKDWCVPSFDFEGRAFREAVGLRPDDAPFVDLKERYRGRPLKRLFHETKRLLLKQDSFKNSKSVELSSPDKYVLLGIGWNDLGHLEALRGLKDRQISLTGMIYDLIPVKHPRFVPSELTSLQARWLGLAFDIFDRFLAISEFTGSELRTRLKETGHTTGVVVTPLAHEFTGSDTLVAPGLFAGRPARPFILMVGTIEARKNAASILRVWRRIVDDLGADAPVLVLAGRIGWGADTAIDYLSAEGLSDHVQIISNASDSELAWLYSNCLFTVFPSYVEGWGLPVGESLWFGKICAASSSSAIPEVGGPLCVYFDPADTADMYDKISRLISDPSLREKAEKDIDRSRLRTWADVAEDVWAGVDDRRH